MSADQRDGDFGGLLQRYRLAAGLSREALAERAGLSATGIGALERGQRRAAHADTVRRLTEALQLGHDDAAALTAAVVRHRTPPMPSDPIPIPPRGSPELVAPLTPLIGRAWDLAVVCGLLLADDRRLVTLTGPAGVGKTRLALAVAEQLARDFPESVVLVDLAPIREPRLVLEAVAERLGLPKSEERTFQQLAQVLQGPRRLVVLDCFEQVLPAARDLPALLAGAPELRLLVTSRSPLGLRSEHVYPVAPLEVPDPDHLATLGELAMVPAVRLFLERARAGMPAFELTEENARPIAELCVHLDGLPLAIKLAAARLQLLSPQMMLERLGQRLSLLRWTAQDLPERQQTLEAAIAWSYELLDPAEQALFRRLGVFAGGFTLEAAEALMDAVGGAKSEVLEGLSGLVGSSLVLGQHETSGHRRYGMLESIREYAVERLAEHDEAEVTSRAHAAYLVGLVEQEEVRLREGDRNARSVLLEEELQNLYEARRWIGEHSDAELELRLATIPSVYWLLGDNLEERRSRLEAALQRISRETSTVGLGGFIAPWIALGDALIQLGELDQALVVLNEALVHARELGDCSTTYACLISLGWCHTWKGDWDEAVKHLDEGLTSARSAEDALEVARAQLFIGEVARMRGQQERAKAYLEDALLGYRELGDMPLVASTLTGLALADAQTGDHLPAIACLRESLDIVTKLHNPWLLDLIGERTILACRHSDDPARAAELLGALETLNRRQGIRRTPRPIERGQLEELVGELESGLGSAAFRMASGRGRALSFEQAVALIRQVLDANDAG